MHSTENAAKVHDVSRSHNTINITNAITKYIQ